MEESIQREAQLNLAQYKSEFSLTNKIGRILWTFSYWLLFRPFSLSYFEGWRNFLLRLFGARIGDKAKVYSSVRIWAPWNLELGSYSSLGPGVDCYNQGRIVIGNNSVISQKVYLCASTHDFNKTDFPLILKSIDIKDSVWIAADAFVAPGKTIGQGSVVAARAAVFKDVDPWTVVGGNPAVYLKERVFK